MPPLILILSFPFSYSIIHILSPFRQHSPPTKLRQAQALFLLAPLYFPWSGFKFSFKAVALQEIVSSVILGK